MNRVLIGLLALLVSASLPAAEQTPAEKLIEAGHWKRARTIVEARLHEAPNDPLSYFLMSQIDAAFGDRQTPLSLAEKAVAMDGRVAKYHRQVAEVLGIVAQQSGAFRQLMLSRRFRKEIDTAISLDPRDPLALRDLMEFYIVAPGIIGGDMQKAATMANRIAAVDPVQGFLARARLASAEKNANEQEAQLKRGVAAEPSSYALRIALAQFYTSPGHENPGAAEQSAQEAVKLDPGRAQAYSILAALYAERDEWNKLDSILAEAAKNVPDDATPFYRAADALIARGDDLPRAERYLQIYLAQPAEGNEPTLAEARGKLAQAQQKEHRG